MKAILKISLVISGVILLSACETVVPPDWRSWDAFKSSIGRTSLPKEESILVTGSILEPSFSLLTESKVIKGKVSIFNDTKLDISHKVSYKYHYIQYSSSQYTPDYERYLRTTTPEVKLEPEFLEIKLAITNNLHHSINSADFSVVLLINGNRVQAKILNPKNIIPSTSESLVIRGPNYSELKTNDKVSLQLYDVTTETNQAGVPLRKDTFAWDMVYNSTKKKLGTPLYEKKEYVLLHYTDAQKAKIGYYTSDIKGKNDKRWDPQDNRWYTSREWDRLRRKESLVQPEGVSNIKVGE